MPPPPDRPILLRLARRRLPPRRRLRGGLLFRTDSLLASPSADGGDLLRPLARRAELLRGDGALLDAEVAATALEILRLLASGQPEGVPERTRAWHLNSLERRLEALPGGSAEVAHLAGLVETLGRERSGGAARRLGLTAYAHFLELEGRLEEALAVLDLAVRTWSAEVAPAELLPYAMLVGRLRRLLSSWESARAAYRLALAAAGALDDHASRLRAELGLAGILRGEGNLPAARAAVEAVLAEARRRGLTELVGLAYLDLGAVLERQGEPGEALRAQFQAFQHATDPVQRMRVLGDVGVMLRELGALDGARLALEVVARSPSSFILQVNACVELMAVAVAAQDRLGFERHRALVQAVEDRLTPAMTVDFGYWLANGLAAFGQLQRAERAFAQALAIAERHRLNQWVFRLEAARDRLRAGAPAAEALPAVTEAVAEVEQGLRELVAS